MASYQRLPPAWYPWFNPRQRYDNKVEPYAFAYARTALKIGVLSLGLGEGDKVLVPEFVCDTVSLALESIGIQVVYYPVYSFLEPKWSCLEERVEPCTKAILMVHYFGQPQDVTRFQQFCKSHSLKLLEDNAHGYGGTFQGQSLGTFGDIGIDSPRKTFPIPNGAYLHTQQPIEICPLPLQPLNLFFSQVKELVKYIVGPFPSLKRMIRKAPKYTSQSAFREDVISDDWGMDQWVHQYISKQDLEIIRMIRQDIYRVWQEWSTAWGLKPVFQTLNKEAVPMIFAAYASSPQICELWFQWGFKHGFDIHSWPTLPKDLVLQDGESMQYWKTMLCFPIHHRMLPHVLKLKLQSLCSPQFF